MGEFQAVRHLLFHYFLWNGRERRGLSDGPQRPDLPPRADPVGANRTEWKHSPSSCRITAAQERRAAALAQLGLRVDDAPDVPLVAIDFRTYVLYNESTLSSETPSDRPSKRPLRAPANRNLPESAEHLDGLEYSLPEIEPQADPRDGPRSVRETTAVYQPDLSFRLGPDLSSRLRLAAYARRWAPEMLAAWLLKRGLDQEPDRVRAEAAMEILTPREREMTRLTSAGKTNHEIAYELGISSETVKSHIRSTLAKLGLHSKAELRLLVQTLDPELVTRLGPEPVQPPNPEPLNGSSRTDEGSEPKP